MDVVMCISYNTSMIFIMEIVIVVCCTYKVVVLM